MGAALKPLLKRLAVGVPGTPSLDLDFLAQAYRVSDGAGGMSSPAFGDLFTFSRPGAALRFNASGVLETVAANQPRFDYDPVTLQPRGLLLEEQRTNLLTYSSDFENAAWGKARSSIQSNVVIAPDGTLTADRLIESTDADNSHTLGQKVNVVADAGCSYSVFAKAAERSAIGFRFYADNSIFSNSQSVLFDLANGVLGNVGTGITASITPVGGGWYRCTATRTAIASGLATISITTALNPTTWQYTGDGVSGVYVWGAQLEIGAFATSPIPTAAAQVTRAADSMSVTSVTPWLVAGMGSMFVDYTPIGYNGGTRVASLSSASGDRVEFVAITGSGANGPGVEVLVGSAAQASLYAGSGAPSAMNYRVATAFAPNSFAISANGSVPVLDTDGSVPTINACWLGRGRTGNPLTGYLRRVRYWPRRVFDNELQRITA